MAPKGGIPFTKHLWDQSRTPNIQQTLIFPWQNWCLLIQSYCSPWHKNGPKTWLWHDDKQYWCARNHCQSLMPIFFGGCVFPNVPQFMAKETRAAYCLVRYIEEYNSLFYRQPKGFQPPLLNRLITPWNQSRAICQWYPHIRYP